MKTKFIYATLVSALVLLLVTPAVALPPPAPTDLTVTRTTEGFKVYWVDNSTNETGFEHWMKVKIPGQMGAVYKLYYDHSTMGNPSNTGPTWFYETMTVQEGATYHFCVRAYNKDGYSYWSNEVVMTIFTPIEVWILPGAPQAPSDLKATPISDSKIKLEWKDNSDIETSFEVWRKLSGDSYSLLTKVNPVAGKGGSAIVEDGVGGLAPLTPGISYFYKVRACNSVGSSAFSNEASGMTFLLLSPLTPSLLAPVAPTNLTAALVSKDSIKLNWKDNSNNEIAFKVERKTGSGSYSEVTSSVPMDWPQFTDSGLLPDMAYTYRVRAFNTLAASPYSNEATVSTPTDPVPKPTPTPAPSPSPSPDPVAPPGTMPDPAPHPSPDPEPEPQPGVSVRLYLNNPEYFVNDKPGMMDIEPTAREGRTLLPIRYVAEPMGAVIGWDSEEQKTSVTLNGKVVEVWVGSNRAMINGKETLIDPQNPAVTPVILPPGRTMLPLRFIAENLGCYVEWNSAEKEVIVTYP